MEKIIGLCSIPNREAALLKVLKSLHKQVDAIELCLNGWKKEPKWLGDIKNLRITRATNEMGDANKYINVGNYTKGYYFSCDDDIIYPGNYISTLIKGIEKYKTIVTIHGSVVRRKVQSYYKGRTMVMHCLNNCPESKVVTVGGTGVMGFDLSYFKPTYEQIGSANMADIWIAKQAHDQGCKITGLPHPAKWIRQARRGATDTIYLQHRNEDSEQTSIINEIFS